jgi:hypothetical protein
MDDLKTVCTSPKSERTSELEKKLVREKKTS